VGVRFQFGSLREVEDQSRRFVTALRRRRARRIESAPEREAFPKGRKLDQQRTLHGRMIDLRRTDGSGAVELLGRRFVEDRRWPHRLVGAEVELDKGMSCRASSDVVLRINLWLTSVQGVGSF
jgi:hypothetical protein